MKRDSFRLLPSKTNNLCLDSDQWAETRRGWIFITIAPNHARGAFRPLISLWIDTLVLRL